MAIAAIPSIGDTERSIPRVMITIVWPVATTMMTTEPANMNEMLLELRN